MGQHLNEHANTKLPVLDQEGASQIIDRDRPRYFFELALVLKAQQIHHHKVNEVIGRQIAACLGTLCVKQEGFVGRRRFGYRDYRTEGASRGIANPL
jgi:hypothetical protein